MNGYTNKQINGIPWTRLWSSLIFPQKNLKKLQMQPRKEVADFFFKRPLLITQELDIYNSYFSKENYELCQKINEKME